MSATSPRVRLPSPRDINPNLTTLIDFIETVIAEQGPAAAAHTCARLARDLGRAAEHPSIAGYLAGPFVVSADCLAAAADWFKEATLACWASTQ